ncbi:MAG: TlpA family protein disulfide reductase [Porticoccaceae bacterium]|nr:TlpA family protein disulfide reductase [Porticoccaceae bacterium]
MTVVGQRGRVAGFVVRARVIIFRAISLGVIVLGLVAACSQAPSTALVIDADGLPWERLRGKVVFINYWAEWCKPCREEIPELNQFARTRSDEVVVLSVNFDGASGETLRAQIKMLGIEFPTLAQDPRAELGVQASEALPETIVLDREGKMFKVLLGPQTMESLETVLFDAERAPKS